MCFNAPVSFLTFALGTVFSTLLINNKSKTFNLENKATGIFFIFISLIQLMDFIFWIDLKNNFGLNKLTTIIGPLLNIGQPVILYLIKYFIYKPNIFSMKDFNLPVAGLNMLYGGNLIYNYVKFLRNDKLVTGVEHGHLKWPWIKYSSAYFYLILLAINIFYLFNFKYASFLFTITYFFFFLSRKYFNYNTAELWCFFGAFIPLIMVFMNLIVR